MPYLSYLGYEREELLEKGAFHTASEIAGQPSLWQEVFKLVQSNEKELSDFLEPVMQLEHLRIILTGAGSSAFIGEAAQGIFQAETGKITQAIATTDLVTHPSLYFLKDVPTLMISFARSGNSPESLEAVRLANRYCSKLFHLIITCNANGELVTNSEGKNVYSFILPESSNDKSLAMTGSFTSMLLAGLLIAKLDKKRKICDEVNRLSANANELLEECLPQIFKVADKSYERVIFLGSGPLLGIARECHLKLQELTDGKVICKHDSFLGFRHGPRVVTNKRSLVVYLFSPDPRVFKYEKDLAQSISDDSPEVPTISFGAVVPGLKNDVLNIEFGKSPGINEFGFILPALLGQLLGFFQCIRLGLQPDNPSISGSINRVVQGVTIYP